MPAAKAREKVRIASARDAARPSARPSACPHSASVSIASVKSPLGRRSLASGLFHGAAREVVHRYKYQGDEKARRVVLEHLPLALAGVAIPRPAAVCAVPMHWLKRLWRGHCAASQLARDAARLLAVPELAFMRRRRFGKPQHELDREHRRKAVLGLYELAPRAQITSGTILLVDDGLTTGATLDTCARLLLEGGASEVRVLTLARG